mgnify:CR=1 FL=1|tara:strand:- start:1283 stop:2275 length:993 start_codon:yes stop_codon:yes gene_type:complete
MNFGKINHIIIFGGALITLELLKLLKKKKIKFHYFTNKRQLKDEINNNLTLLQNLKINKIKYNETSNINKNILIKKIIKKNSLGIALGPPWGFKKKILKLFNGRLLDFMPIPMPKYRGGAHYSWMILNKDFDGGIYLQNINHKTSQASSDSGYYFESMNYKFPKNLINPKDFFEYSVKKEITFFKNFLNKIKKKSNFKLKKLDERNSTFFPRLISSKNAFINWNWKADDIVQFINAFGEPYMGAISLHENKKLFIKKAKLLNQNSFHSLEAGSIIKKEKGSIFIAGKEGIILTNEVYDNKNNSIISKIKKGNKFYNNQKDLFKSKLHLKF